MSETDYFEPGHLLHEWQRGQKNVTPEQTAAIYAAEGHIEGYTGYPDVQMDIAQTVLSQLIESAVPEPMPDNVHELKPQTQYVVSKYDVETRKLLP